MPDATELPVAVGPWRRRRRRDAYANPWITIWHDEVQRPDGSDGIYGVVHFANRAVGMVVLDDDDRVLLVGQHRYALDAYSWEIPEGGVPEDEDLLEGAIRELREETGVEADEWRSLCRLHLSNSVTDEAGIVFAARARQHGVATPEATEDLATRWVPFDAAMTMIAMGEITDALTIIGLQAVALEPRRAAQRDGGSEP
jgi:8-oxo-dGTP pyrophosphatase MutT (NUDIX family)